MERGTVINGMQPHPPTSIAFGPALQVGVLKLAQPGDAWASEVRLSLSPREFAVLWALAARPGHIVPREELFAEVWGGAMSHRDRSVDVHVRRLRQKLAGGGADVAVHPHPPSLGVPPRAPARSREEGPVMKQVLFVCTHNAGRSQMAEAFFNQVAPSDVRALSAGSDPRRDGVWPSVLEAMLEIGLDLGDRRPTRLTTEMQLQADWGITLACGATCPYVAAKVEDWDVEDPAGRSLEEVRVIRDDVRIRVERFIATRLDEVRADRTAHQWRLGRLLPQLQAEFAGVRDDADIRACADETLAQFDDAAVRAHVMTIAHRQARECLAAGRCRTVAA